MKRTLFLALLLLNCVIHSSAQIITTIAGGMRIGYTGDGGPAADALLNQPSGIATDKWGNIYFGDTKNYCVRRIDPLGIITTIAGNGTKAIAIENVPATSTSLYQVLDIAVDTFGDVYICNADSRIHKVTMSTGIMNTVIGTGIAGFSGDNGPATKAMIENATGIAIDGKNNIYIADGYNRVRKIDPSGIIKTIAGNGAMGDYGDGKPATSAAFQELHGLCADAAGNVYVADARSECIRKIDTNGIIRTVAGNHYGSGIFTGGYTGDGGAATTAELYYPQFVAVDKNQNLYISDYDNQRIRKVNAASGIMTTIAGDGIKGYNGDGKDPTLYELYYPSGVAIDQNGRIYIADAYNNRIRSISSTLDVGGKIYPLEQLDMYPNPCKNDCIISYTLPGATGDVHLHVCDALGRLLLSKNLGAQRQGVNKFSFTPDLPDGIYYYTLSGNEFSVTKKMTIIK